ncbi:methyltransferase domain-containing protein [Paroceanicella profunda]|uniref:Methyltransferase domain-containing protein n=1 Tax=Paroceanicella profunda TaxID=2579971 RepID=A0A5B8FZZ8_9RHOB|nr:methyltransferase domain-containing protein [Paroceanicella profunda]QDL93030.1 methyltransferase domain-containing protein [Paroceanicella profunda]
MSGFAPDWLALRDPADRAARSRTLRDRLLTHLFARPGGRPLRVIDLGCGTGATWRALAPLLPPDTEWCLVDHDPALLAAARTALGDSAQISFLEADLAASVEETLARGADLVTSSALIDLCSAEWLSRLGGAVPPGAAVYMALNYDGTEHWEPAHDAEPRAHAAFLDHHRRDKGFGPALGAEAPAHLSRVLAARGWTVRSAASPWRLSQAHRGLIAALAEGSAQAVAETGALSPAEHAAWAASRRSAESVMIGHTDLLALPPA